jgi:hypothetical protein
VGSHATGGRLVCSICCPYLLLLAFIFCELLDQLLLFESRTSPLDDVGVSSLGIVL